VHRIAGLRANGAQGARSAKSPFAGKLDLFYEAEIQIARSKRSNLHTLREVALTNPFGGIRGSYLRTQTAAYFVELIEISTEAIITSRSSSRCCVARSAS
jgi:DNA repair protein RecO (recombination protein O)